MTNSEALLELKESGMYGNQVHQETIEIAIKSLQENDKLKSEIERIKNESHRRSDMFLQEIERLKSELHQLTYRNCLRCSHYGKCSINDNFNITNCSDFELKGKV